MKHEFDSERNSDRERPMEKSFSVKSESNKQFYEHMTNPHIILSFLRDIERIPNRVCQVERFYFGIFKV